MRNALFLCGAGNDGDIAADWVEDLAKDHRLGPAVARRHADRIRAAYQTACASLVCSSGERPVMKISLHEESFAPRFDMVDTAAPQARATPRAVRAMRMRDAAIARRDERLAALKL